MIKIIAFSTMIIDHIGVIFFPGVNIFRIIGRLSFPLFAWSIARGYKFTKDFNRYAIRLFLLGIISQFPYYFLFRNGNLNICFTLLTGLLVLKLYDSTFPIFIKWTGIISLSVLSQYLHFEYGIYGVTTIFLFFKYWQKESVIYYQGILTLLSILLFKYDPMQLVSGLSSIIILFLNNKEFKLHKIVQYSFYPCHLFLLFFIKYGG